MYVPTVLNLIVHQLYISVNLLGYVQIYMFHSVACQPYLKAMSFILPEKWQWIFAKRQQLVLQG
jgi:hypothetical protein